MLKANNFNSFLGSAQLEKDKSLGHYELRAGFPMSTCLNMHLYEQQVISRELEWSL